MVDHQKFPSDNDRHLTDAFSALGEKESRQPDELTRRRHLSAMSATRSRSYRSQLLGAAAAIAVVVAGVVITSHSNNSGDVRTRNQVAELQPLKEVKDLTPIPFDRTEDYVILDVDAKRADAVSQELTTLMGSSPAIAGKNSRTTTFVVASSVAKSLSDTTGIVATPDTPMKATAEQLNPPSWGLDRIDATDVALNNSYKYYSTGASSYVYVIDTGVYSGHSDLSGRVISGYTAVNDGRGTEDCNGHGTHVAGTIAGTNFGVAKETRIVAVRVLDCTGSGYTSSVVAGINWVIASHPGGAGVINMSLGGGANSSVDTAVENAAAAGLTVVVAAGNSSADACNYSPARAPSALTIGAINKGDTQASYSNTGSCVDMWAPGTSITSDWIGGSSATNTISGTSMASPHVAGLASRLAQAFPGITSSEIAAKLTTNKLSSLSVSSFVEDPPVDTTTTLDPGTTTTTAPVVTTTVPGSTTTVPGSTTTVPKSTTTTVAKAPGQGKAPGRNKAVMTPREFSVKNQSENGDNTLVASWVDDQSPEMYKVECSRNKGQEMKDDSADSLDAESGIFITRANVKVKSNGRSEAELVMSPAPKSLCWIVAMIGDTKSGRSNVAVIPKPVTVPTVPPSTVPPTTVAPTTTAPPATVPVTTAAPVTTVASAGKSPVTTKAPVATAPATTAPKAPATTAPKSNTTVKPGNSKKSSD